MAGTGKPLHLTIGHTDVHGLVANVEANRPDLQAAEYRRIAEQLAAAGAERVAITSMGGRFCAPEFAAISPLPLINGPGAVAAYLQAEDLSKVGLIGTRVVMQTGALWLDHRGRGAGAGRCGPRPDPTLTTLPSAPQARRRRTSTVAW